MTFRPCSTRRNSSSRRDGVSGQRSAARSIASATSSVSVMVRRGRSVGMFEMSVAPKALVQHLPRYLWHTCGMSRTRVSTTVDAELLANARRALSGVTDAALIDAALTALLSRHRAAELDASYSAYDEHPLDEPDEWGDLASFRRAAAAS